MRLGKGSRALRTYIVPTRFGFYFAFLCLVLFVTAFAYGNNFLYFFVFWMVSTGVMGLLVTNSIVNWTEIQEPLAESFFAGEVGSLEVHVRNQSRWGFRDLRLQLDRSLAEERSVEDLLPRSTKKVQWPLRGQERGYLRLPEVRLETNFPFGFSLAWKTLRNSSEVLVWPARRGLRLRELLQSLKSTGEGPMQSMGSPSRHTDGSLPEQFRPFQNHDSPAQIHWKLYARLANLYIGESVEEPKAQLMFSDEDLPDVDKETRISQLALWLADAESEGYLYGLVFEGRHFPIANGQHHLVDLLNFLARA